ncbi:hypothetical protein SLA2020_206860 [Shorea laevis]
MEDGEMEEEMVVEERKQVTPPTKVEKSPYDMLKESKASVEEIVAKILFIKRENKPKSELRELLTQTFLHFVTLHQVNRTILLEEDMVKVETEKVKAQVDLTTLQLHNLMYEKSHYVKAIIKACKDFKSKYLDIELVPEEEFFGDATEEIKESHWSNDSFHNLMLKRLNYELFQRKELCKLLEKLEQCKKGLLETIANRKKFLSSLPSHIKSLKKASLPKEAFAEEIDLEIVGTVKDAQAFACQQANKDNESSTNVENSKLEDDALDDEDDGQRRKKRPKRVPSKDILDPMGLYQVHPLKITLHVYDDDASDPKTAKLISLKFEYMLKLNVVCVGIEGSNEGPENNVLCNLFPEDTGLDLPHQSAKLFVGDAFVFDERRTSFPYKWAQHLAGIDFLPKVSPLLTSHETQSSETKSDSVISSLALYRQQNRVQMVVQRIRVQRKVQLALVEQLDSLMKLKWPPLNSNQASSQPVTDTEQVQETMAIDKDGRAGTSKEELEIMRDWELPALTPATSVMKDGKLSTRKRGRKCCFGPLAQHYEVAKNSRVEYGVQKFCLVLTRKVDDSERNLKLEAKLQISMGCTKNKVHATEAEVNLHMLKMAPPDQESFILSRQVYCLAMLFNYRVDEASPSSVKRKGGSVIDVGLCKPVSGRLLARSFRGSDQRRMMSWKDMKCAKGFPFQ